MVSTRSATQSVVAITTDVALTSGRPTKRARTNATVTEVKVDEKPSNTVATGKGRKQRAPAFTTLEESTSAEPADKKPKPRWKAKVQIETDPVAYTQRIRSEWKIGAHVSAAGGVENAILNAASIGANAFALFLKSQRQWAGPPLSDESRVAFTQRLEAFGYDAKHVLPHGNYLVNMGNPDASVREKSYACFVDELRRCEALGLHLFNFHPGSTVGGCSVEESLKHIANCINRAHEETSKVVIVIENMAGAGNIVGGDFAHIAEIISQVEDKSRVGVCIDTCHAFAAGYDIRTKEGWEDTMSKFDAVVGIQYLRGMHLNDSKSALGSHKDRHNNLGCGEIGMHAFAHIVADPRTRDIPLILETPAHESKDGAVWRTEIASLYALVPDRTVETALTVVDAAEEVRKAVGVAETAERKAKAEKEKRSLKRKPAEKRKRRNDDDSEDIT